MLRRWFLLLAAAGVLCAQDGPRLLVVTGGHEHDTSFYTLFDGYNAVCAQPSQFAFRGELRKKYDVLVLYDMMQDLNEVGRKHLQNFVEGGKGLVVLHHAIADYNDWEWWYRDVMGAKYLLKPDLGMPASTYKHDQELQVKVAAKHAITEGISDFAITDEGYKGMWHSKQNKVLLTVDHPASDAAVAWVSPYAKSRVAVIQLGHDHLAHQNANYRRLVKNAIEWAAGRKN